MKKKSNTQAEGPFEKFEVFSKKVSKFRKNLLGEKRTKTFPNNGQNENADTMRSNLPIFGDFLNESWMFWNSA